MTSRKKLMQVSNRPEPTVWGDRLPFGTICGEFSSPNGGWVHDVAFSPSGDVLAFVSAYCLRSYNPSCLSGFSRSIADIPRPRLLHQHYLPLRSRISAHSSHHRPLSHSPIQYLNLHLRNPTHRSRPRLSTNHLHRFIRRLDSFPLPR